MEPSIYTVPAADLTLLTVQAKGEIVGWLEKQGAKGIFKGFRKRFCHSRTGKLYYYAKESLVDPLGFIDLDVASEVKADLGRKVKCASPSCIVNVYAYVSSVSLYHIFSVFPLFPSLSLFTLCLSIYLILV